MISPRIAVFPGSFDPFTLGHEFVVLRALLHFDKVIVAIGANSTKSSFFSLEQRMEFICAVFRGNERVEVRSYEGLTVEYCKTVLAKAMIRGLRSGTDLDFERGICSLNRTLAPDIETFFILADGRFTDLSSTLVRDILKNGGSINPFVPPAMHSLIS